MDFFGLFTLTTQQALLVPAAFCLLMGILLLIAVSRTHGRAVRAERQAKALSDAVRKSLAKADERAQEDGENVRQDLQDAMQNVNENMLRMMGEISRTQQGQMDALGGQLRAAGMQEEERMERMRRTVEHRLSSYEEKLGGISRTLHERLSGSDAHMERMTRTLEGGLQKLGEESRSQMEAMRSTVDEKLNATLDARLEESFSNMTRRLEQVTESLGAMQRLAGSVDTLDKLVGGAQPLGIVGETQLGVLLGQMLAPQQYAQHARVRPGGEPVADYVVVMPGQAEGRTVYLPMDCSLPQREYLELRTAMEEGTREDVKNARGLLESAVRMHARRMSEKLIAPPYTTDYAVLFLPSEGMFAEILRMNGLAERIQQESRMVLAGPTTLAALLTSLQMGFRSLAIEQRTQEVSQLLGAVRTDFAGFAALLNRTQKKLQQATAEIEHAQQRTQHIARRLSDVKALPRQEADRLLEDEESPFDDDDEWD